MLADIIVTAVVAAFIAAGWKKGFLKSLMGMVSFALSLIVAFLIYPKVSELLASTPLYTFLTETVKEGYISKHLAEGGSVGIFSAEYFGGELELFAGNLADGITDVMINIIAFILTLVASRLIIWIVTKTLDLFAKLPGIKMFNKLLGGVIGGLKGILILYIVFAVAVVFVPFKEDSMVLDSIEKSMLASEMYNDNVLLNLIDKGESGI